MRLCVPEYYEHFQCSASACQDNCCIGWEIDIDPESDRQYRQVGGAFGARLQGIHPQGGGYSLLPAGGGTLRISQ